MRKKIDWFMPFILVGLGCLGIVIYDQGFKAGRQTERAARPAQAPMPTPIQHHYRFERNGASLWRFDETTGESCQITSNVSDGWVGGHCPAIVNEPASNGLDQLRVESSEPPPESGTKKQQQFTDVKPIQ